MRGRLGLWLTVLALAVTSVPAFTQTLEGVFSPGPLFKGHAKYEENCRACHIPFDRAAQTRLCADCHKEIRADLRTHTRFHGRLKDATCRNCHTEHEGRNARITRAERNDFDHDATNFPLRGGHQKIAPRCGACHQPNAKYREAQKECVACHRKDDNDKGHKGKLGEKCADCHSVENWKVPKFDHDKTRFRLEGAHAKTKCSDCHADKTYRDTPRECIGCHKKDDDKKGHKGHFGAKCAACHSAREWKESLFDHERDAHYALKGKHFEAKCVACHVAPLYTDKLPSRCIACHRKDDNQKGHKGSLGERCESCHNERGWKEAAFDHDKDTDFPLVGKHRQAKCEGCHQGGVTVRDGKTRLKAPRECIGCHRKDDNEKGHKGKFGEKCVTCHVARGWKEITFRHERDTKYALDGKHAQARCVSCHTGELYKEKTPTDCVACHRKDDNDKGHKGKFGGKCQSCHTAQNWKEITFRHDRDTKYALVGKHAQTRCVSCHTGELYKEKTPTECIACHRKDDEQKGHKGTLGTRCDGCHTAEGWKLKAFDHNKTRFPLLGSHSRVECAKCHKGVAFRDAPRDCFGCHQKDDVHKRRLGTDCETCHNARSWKSWDFDHGKTVFPLTGAHRNVACYACHKAPMEKQRGPHAAPTCASCHEKDDVHKGVFGANCDRCHTDSNWKVILRR